MLLTVRPPDQHVRALTERILAQPQYAKWRRIGAGFQEQLVRWLAEFLSWTRQLHIHSPVLFWLLLTGVCLIALALLTHIVWSVRSAFALQGPAEDRQRPTGAPRWAEEAEQLARQGRFLDGAHRLLLGSIDVLVKRGLIELRRADANRVLRDRLRRSALPDAASARFLVLLDAFEERWFRDRVEDGELYQAWRELHEQLVKGARGAA
jgi:hypothetical protein